MYIYIYVCIPFKFCHVVFTNTPSHPRLAVFALCNLVANHAGNKRLARRLGCVREMSALLRTSPVLEIQDAAAACIYNIACKTDKEEVLRRSPPSPCPCRACPSPNPTPVSCRMPANTCAKAAADRLGRRGGLE